MYIFARAIQAICTAEEEEEEKADSLLGDAAVELLLGLPAPPLPPLPPLLGVVVPPLGLPLPPAGLDPEEEEEELDPVDEEEEGAGEADKG